jgi:hypothetical protein
MSFLGSTFFYAIYLIFNHHNWNQLKLSVKLNTQWKFTFDYQKSVLDLIELFCFLSFTKKIWVKNSYKSKQAHCTRYDCHVYVISKIYCVGKKLMLKNIFIFVESKLFKFLNYSSQNFNFVASFSVKFNCLIKIEIEMKFSSKHFSSISRSARINFSLWFHANGGVMCLCVFAEEENLYVCCKNNFRKKLNKFRGSKNNFNEQEDFHILYWKLE